LLNKPGVIGIIWSIYWWYYSYERPAIHPKISESERIYIEESIGESCSISNKVNLLNPKRNELNINHRHG
jgi:hypothetical protein